MAARRLRIVGLIMLVVAGLVTVGAIQGVILQVEVITTTTTSPDPATALAIISAIAILLCAGVVSVVVWVRRGHRGNTNHQK